MLVIAIKDQNIPSLYPNITLDKIVDAGFFVFPHGIDEAEYRANVGKKEVKKVKLPKEPELSQAESGLPKRKAGRPRKVIA